MEVLLDKTRTVGVSYHAGTGESVAGQPSLLLGGFNANNTMNPTALVNNLGGLSAALFGPTTGDLGNSTLFKGLPINIPSFGVFLQLLQTNNDVNILSNPHILIMNNQEGEISVGEVLPFPGTTTAALGPTAGGGVGYLPFTSVQRQPVELKLKLTPSVNEHDIIRIDVDQEISDVESQNYNGMGPATSKRSVKTTVVARDQQTVVIGGLMADRISENVTKIPILGDIPVLGFFFRNTTKTVKKSNILIAITPYVVSDLSDLRRVAEKKLRERREFIERYSSLEDTSKLEQQEIDTHRKRGMIEEINRSVREMEEDERQLQLIRERDQRDESTPIEPSEEPETESKQKEDNAGVRKASVTAPASDEDSPAGGGGTRQARPPSRSRTSRWPWHASALVKFSSPPARSSLRRSSRRSRSSRARADCSGKSCTRPTPAARRMCSRRSGVQLGIRFLSRLSRGRHRWRAGRQGAYRIFQAAPGDSLALGRRYGVGGHGRSPRRGRARRRARHDRRRGPRPCSCRATSCSTPSTTSMAASRTPATWAKVKTKMTWARRRNWSTSSMSTTRRPSFAGSTP